MHDYQCTSAYKIMHTFFKIEIEKQQVTDYWIHLNCAALYLTIAMLYSFFFSPWWSLGLSLSPNTSLKQKKATSRKSILVPSLGNSPSTPALTTTSGKYNCENTYFFSGFTWYVSYLYSFWFIIWDYIYKTVGYQSAGKQFF